MATLSNRRVLLLRCLHFIIVRRLHTKKMLHGLTDDSVETILTQLRIARQHGTILQSDVWTAPDGARKVRDELFYSPR